MKSWLWILLIHCSRLILLCYLYLNTNQLLHQILKLVDLGAERTVKSPRLLQFPIKIRLMIRHVRLDKRKLLFPNHLLRHQIRPHGLLPWRQQSSTPTLPRHMDEYMLDWVMSKTFSSGRIWVNIILYFGWTTLKRRPPTTHLT